jgi:hypothetical protein
LTGLVQLPQILPLGSVPPLPPDPAARDPWVATALEAVFASCPPGATVSAFDVDVSNEVADVELYVPVVFDAVKVPDVLGVIGPGIGPAGSLIARSDPRRTGGPGAVLVKVPCVCTS